MMYNRCNAKQFSVQEAEHFLASWYRVVEDDGSTVAYAPDETTARLIATGPEMLSTLRGALTFLEDDSRSPRRRAEILGNIRAALAKVKGGSR